MSECVSVCVSWFRAQQMILQKRREKEEEEFQVMTPSIKMCYNSTLYEGLLCVCVCVCVCVFRSRRGKS